MDAKDIMGVLSVLVVAFSILVFPVDNNLGVFMAVGGAYTAIYTVGRNGMRVTAIVTAVFLAAINSRFLTECEWNPNSILVHVLCQIGSAVSFWFMGLLSRISTASHPDEPVEMW